MSLKSIFAPMAFEQTVSETCDAGLLLAEAFKGHLLAHHVRQRFAPYPSIDYFATGVSVAVTSQASHDEATAAFARVVRAAFEESCDRNGARIVPVSEALKRAGVTASWTQEAGDVSLSYSHAARIADLVVAALPDPSGFYLEGEVLEAILLQSGAPLLLVPRQGLKALPSRPLVAWDGSLQAARTVRAALPLLQKSEATTLLTIEDSDAGTPDLDAARLWLLRAGVKVSARAVDWPEGAVGERILNQCEATNSDLIVLGGYSHSRIRETLIGGVTRHILRHAERPVFLAH